jgi:hypothetical protein
VNKALSNEEDKAMAAKTTEIESIQAQHYIVSRRTAMGTSEATCKCGKFFGDNTKPPFYSRVTDPASGEIEVVDNVAVHLQTGK